jgi:hypothetical protein
MDVTTTIGTFIGASTHGCEPFVWTKDPDELLAKIKPSKC